MTGLLNCHQHLKPLLHNRQSVSKSQDLPRQSSKGKELLLPDHLSVQDFAQTSAAAQVTEAGLSRAPQEDAQPAQATDGTSDDHAAQQHQN
ncbi:hypothetical protein GUJ93_ZPchr0011g28750 [Zizania palustris]|uniref:Uncharacterized protein n=1 Tax=Zizania palustris TaxID=103762 RepID=A0A8J6BLY5_ZIZPA|nr:hypothetical protein GUJ93_ZPchr0011g28750 [Zizania palustris]